MKKYLFLYLSFFAMQIAMAQKFQTGDIAVGYRAQTYRMGHFVGQSRYSYLHHGVSAYYFRNKKNAIGIELMANKADGLATVFSPAVVKEIQVPFTNSIIGGEIHYKMLSPGLFSNQFFLQHSVSYGYFKQKTTLDSIMTLTSSKLEYAIGFYFRPVKRIGIDINLLNLGYAYEVDENRSFKFTYRRATGFRPRLSVHYIFSSKKMF